MATMLYSTHYGTITGSVWNWRIAGIFQVKEDPYDDLMWHRYSTSHDSSSEGLNYLAFDYGPLIDYDTARHWPHP